MALPTETNEKTQRIEIGIKIEFLNSHKKTQKLKQNCLWEGLVVTTGGQNPAVLPNMVCCCAAEVLGRGASGNPHG